MTAATGTTLLQSALTGAALAIFLAACQPADPAAAIKRVEAKWVDRQMLFVGDNRVGAPSASFHTRSAPQLVGELRAPGRGRCVTSPSTRRPTASGCWEMARSICAMRNAFADPPHSGGGQARRLALDASGRPLLIAADGANGDDRSADTEPAAPAVRADSALRPVTS